MKRSVFILVTDLFESFESFKNNAEKNIKFKIVFSRDVTKCLSSTKFHWQCHLEVFRRGSG